MTRHRGKFNIDKVEPYELSRSRIENFIQCPACFFMQQVEGIVFPSIPSFNINEATDVLLKRDFDRYRGTDKTHPFLIKSGLNHLIPFQHEHFELWTQSLHFGAENRLNFDHKETNIRVGGGLDDVWLNTKTRKIHVVDYKSTSQRKNSGPITLDDKWKSAYKRQMDLYCWILSKKGFDVDKIGYFLYCDADRFTNREFLLINQAIMEFKITLIPYSANFEWIEETLREIFVTLRLNSRPKHSEQCEYGSFLHQSNTN
tara:strand:+ start:702 stop:1475 length:774 start_codon:yes stop_codon:yes gene_type:complete